LADVGLGPIDVLLVPLERQIAEKLHAYTRPYDSGGSTRVKDLVDFVIIRLFERMDADRLRDAINETFSRRRTHPAPNRLPPPPAEWAVAYRDEAEAVGITRDLSEAHTLAAAWLNPVLDFTARGTWDPQRALWSS
jgi:nucleotidyltransferase AbiEii toxin of type IV toxin-antitoxin system